LPAEGLHRDALRPTPVARLGRVNELDRGEDLGREVGSIRWFHTIELGPGVITPGQDDSKRKLGWIKLPTDLRGKTVLDVGAWDGFFSFEAERRGAARVVAVDPACWRDPPWGPNGWGTQSGFNLARRVLRSSVEDVDIDLLEIAPEAIGMFDVVLFLGVLYHLPDPWPYLERVASVARERLIVETHADFIDLRRPAVAYYPGDEIDGDPSNWWGPNPAMLRAKLRELGFATTDVVHQESRVYRAARAGYRRLRGDRRSPMQGRVVVHGLR
jgi:tRNA (mo5U34)-methyltransferase